MKIFTAYIRSRNFLLTLGTFIVLSPFAYAASQNTGMMSSMMTGTNFIFSSSTPNEAQKAVAEVKILPEERVRKGVIENIDTATNSFTLRVLDRVIIVKNNATTTFYSGDGEEIDRKDINEGAKVYVFGYVASNDSVMSASKIVITNKSKMERK